MSKTPSKVRAWAVVHGEGEKAHICALSIASTRADAIGRFASSPVRWRWWRRQGYRAKRVHVQLETPPCN